ncbi:Na(+)-translocating NADH-quinone reductase subunit C [Thalassoroseus pseudoceratinae]|uniref:Na(+)-translocating NADH-quinone reductase subunit C n=1 Tax=Thalassoroseus pseudoceratinae TaxID=2713176 RepID=UPI00141FE3EB|nr:Na(+)-translocating NADH-quinone reductase subunit C [Thalassoroseus pseudoceratinae]
MPRDSFVNTFKVALLLCLGCSLLVSAAAIGLRDQQKFNKLREQQKNILVAAGAFDPEVNSVSEVPKLFEEKVEVKLIDLDTGEVVPSEQYSETIMVENVSEYDQRRATTNSKLSYEIPGEEDIANIKTRENYSQVYFVKNDEGKQSRLVLPIRGYGLWSILRGFISVDLTTLSDDPSTLEVAGLTYYEQAETPGLGGEVDNPSWKALWQGKHIYDSDGNVELDVVKQPNSDYEVDALAGATITSNGVANMMSYWFGENGFGPYLKQQMKQ